MRINLINDNFKSDYVNNLLVARGVTDLEAYFNPDVKYLQSPSHFKNIMLAAALYGRVVNSNGRILIVVDSDCDGFTSAAIIYQYTKRMNPNCQIDYWLHEGKQHGLQDHIDRILDEEHQYDLIILPDSSSNDATYHNMLEEVNIPCLILDHHETDVKLSDNAVVVNNQLSPNYINKDLTGAGVVYQFCRYIDSINGTNWAEDYMDLAAWGIVGDMGSMLSLENRYIVYTGFDINHIQNDFLKCLLKKQGYSITGNQFASWEQIVEKVNPISIAFYIVPMINAMIRVGSMEEKERLFIAFIDGARMIPCNKRGAKGTLERADVESARECTNAKNAQNRTKEKVVDILEARIFKYDLLENKILLIELEEEDDFPSELNGLVATQLANKYKIPTLVGRRNSEGKLRGSIRGLNDSELKDFKKFLTDSGLFDFVQGHANAAGYAIDGDKVDSLLNYANNALAEVNFGENVHDVNFSRVGTDSDLSALVTEIGSYSGIWGQNTGEPLIHVSHIKVDPSNVRIMGANKDTVRIDYCGMSYLKFKASDLIEEIQSRTGPFTLEVVGRANLNEWCGRYTPQLFIDDYDIQ
jgi:single-stranded-DNA-specific exonuclease